MKMFTVATAAATRDITARRSAFAVNRSKSASEMGSAALNAAKRKCRVTLSEVEATNNQINNTNLFRMDNTSNVAEVESSNLQLSIPIRTASLSHSNLESLLPLNNLSISSAQPSNDWSAITRLSITSERDDVDVHGKRCSGRRRHYDLNGSVIEHYSAKKRFINVVNQIRLENNVLNAFADVSVASPSQAFSSTTTTTTTTIASTATTITASSSTRSHSNVNHSQNSTNSCPELNSSTKQRFNALMRIKMFAIKRQNKKKLQNISQNNKLNCSFDESTTVTKDLTKF